MDYVLLGLHERFALPAPSPLLGGHFASHRPPPPSTLTPLLCICDAAGGRWATGCILGELYGNKPMFPGSSTMNQLERVLTVTGRPSDEDVDAIHSPFCKTMLDRVPEVTRKVRDPVSRLHRVSLSREAMLCRRPYCLSFRRDPQHCHLHHSHPLRRLSQYSHPRIDDFPGQDLEELYPRAPPDALDLMARLLVFNPNHRLTAEEALEHPFVADFHNPGPSDTPRGGGGSGVDRVDGLIEPSGAVWRVFVACLLPTLPLLVALVEAKMGCFRTDCNF